MQSVKRKIRYYGIPLVVILVVLAGFYLLLAVFILNDNPFQNRFHSGLWKQMGNHPETDRHNMALDLISSNKLAGLSIREVESLLGKPERIENNNKAEAFFYYLGAAEGNTSYEQEWLKISFSCEGKLIDANITNDSVVPREKSKMAHTEDR